MYFLKKSRNRRALKWEYSGKKVLANSVIVESGRKLRLTGFLMTKKSFIISRWGILVSLSAPQQFQMTVLVLKRIYKRKFCFFSNIHASSSSLGEFRVTIFNWWHVLLSGFNIIKGHRYAFLAILVLGNSETRNQSLIRASCKP